MNEQFPFDLFLSRNSKAEAVVGAVKDGFRSDGLKVWFERMGAQAGRQYAGKDQERAGAVLRLVLCRSLGAVGCRHHPVSRPPEASPLHSAAARRCPLKPSLAQPLYISSRPNNIHTPSLNSLVRDAYGQN